MSSLDTKTVDGDSCWWNLWFSRERKAITRKADMMQKEVKGYWRPVTYRYDAFSGSKTKEEELEEGKRTIGWIYYRKAWLGSPLLGDRELKYDRHNKKCGECFWEKRWNPGGWS